MAIRYLRDKHFAEPSQLCRYYCYYQKPWIISAQTNVHWQITLCFILFLPFRSSSEKDCAPTAHKRYMRSYNS